MEYEIQTISPVNIGVGDERKLTNYDYIQRNGSLIVFNLGTFFSENPSRAEEFYNEASKKGFSLHKFLREEELTNTDYHHYVIKSSNAPNKRGLAPLIKTPQNEAYLPGSSIKGAIRTALASYVLSKADSDTWEKVKNGERNTDIRGINRNSNPKQVGKEVEKVLFGCGSKTKRNFKKYGDPKFDLLKFVRVTDSNAISAGEDTVEHSIIDTFSQQKDESLKGKRFNSSLETISPGTKLNFKIEIDKGFLFRANEMETDRQWIGLKQKLKQVFDINAGIDSAEEAAEKVYKTIEKACRYHSKNIIDKDLDILPSKPTYLHKTCGRPVADDFRYKNKKWCHKCQQGNLGPGGLVEVNFNKVRKFLEGTKNQLNGEFLIHLGFGVGWHSTTIGMVMDDRTLQNMRKKFRLGKTSIREFPKTRRFVVENGIPKYPLGWVKVCRRD